MGLSDFCLSVLRTPFFVDNHFEKRRSTMNNNYYQPARDFIPVVEQDAEMVLAYNQMIPALHAQGAGGPSGVSGAVCP